MNSIRKNIIWKAALICAALILCLFLYSCKDANSGITTGDTVSGTEVKGFNWSDYKIVIGSGNDSAATARELREAIIKNFGEDIQIVSDSEGGHSFEILVGKTNRDASSELIGGLEPYSFAIVQSGGKIVIAGTNEYLTRKAVDYFIGYYVGLSEGEIGTISYRSGSLIPLYMVENSKASARIVYTSDGGETALAAAKSIHDKIKSLTGADVGIYSSSAVSDNGGTEILIGMTGRAESGKATSGLAYGRYAVCVNGNKLVVNAWDESGLQAAAEELCDILQLMYQPAVGNLCVFTDMQEEGVFNQSLSVLPAAGNGNFSKIYYNGDESYIVVLTEIKETGYTGYNDKLYKCGFTRYTDNEINGNLFYTFTNDSYAVTNIFLKCSGEMRIIVESLSATSLPGLTEDDTGNRDISVTSLVTQIGLEVPGNTEDYQNGMSYVIRLEDGSFIIIDGGHDRAANANNLYKILRSQAPDANNIVVAAWIFTHAHTDHMGTFRNFTAYGKYVKVEKFIFNFTDENKPESEALMFEYITGTKKEIADVFPDAKVYKAHPGQIYHIRNAEIEILYSLELLTPDDLSNYNRTSLMFTVQLEGEKLMFLGDCTVESSDLVCRMYDKMLACDFVQVGHHGYSGGSTELYALIDPTYVLWPLADYTYETTHRDATRNIFFKVSKKIQKICVAGDHIWVVELNQGNITFTEYDNVNAYLK